MPVPAGQIDVWCFQTDTVFRAGINTLLAASAGIRVDHMQLFGGTDDGIRRAGFIAAGAAGAQGFVNHSGQCFGRITQR